MSSGSRARSLPAGLAQAGRCARMQSAGDRRRRPAWMNDGQLHAQLAQAHKRCALGRHRPLAGKPANRAIVVVRRLTVGRRIQSGRRTVVVVLHVLAGGAGQLMIVMHVVGMVVAGMVVEQTAQRRGRQIGSQQQAGRQTMSARMEHDQDGIPAEQIGPDRYSTPVTRVRSMLHGLLARYEFKAAWAWP